MTDDEKLLLGRQSARLLEEETFRKALDACLVHCQMRWAGSAPDENVSRETLYHEFKAVHAVEGMLRNFVEEGTRIERERNGDKTG